MRIEPPPTHELFGIKELAARHPNLLSESRIRWAMRNRAVNGLADLRAVFESRAGELLIHEPAFIAWFLGLSGRARPRATFKGKRVRK